MAWAGQAVEVAFDAAMLAWPLPRSDSRIFGYLAGRAAALLTQVPKDADPLEAARREIGDSLVARRALGGLSDERVGPLRDRGAALPRRQRQVAGVDGGRRGASLARRAARRLR